MMNSNTALPAQKARALAAALLLGLALPAAANDNDTCESAAGDESIAACSRIIKMGGTTSKGELANVYNNRGAAKVKKGDTDGAIADFGRAIELDRKNPWACFNRGQLRMDKDDTDGAIADFSCDIANNPEHVEAYMKRGIAKAAKNDMDGVIADMNHVLDLDGNNALAFFIRALAKDEKNDLDGALADFNRSIEINPKNPTPWVNRSATRGKKGDYDGALADANHAIELDPERVAAYLNRAIAKHLKGDDKGALADYARAIELDPKNPSTYADRGGIREDQGELDGAIADLNRAIELDPNYDIAFRMRGRVYFMKGNYAAAAGDFVRASNNKAGPDLNAYDLLWLYLSRGRSKVDGKNELAASAAKLPKAKWPAPLIEFYLGHGSPESVRAAAKNPDSRVQGGQVCEVNFYLAQWLLLSNDVKGARPLLEDAAKNCPKDFVEYGAAALELQRLAAKP